MDQVLTVVPTEDEILAAEAAVTKARAGLARASEKTASKEKGGGKGEQLHSVR